MQTKLDSLIHLRSNSELVDKLGGRELRELKRRVIVVGRRSRWALATRTDEIPPGVVGVYAVYDATIKALVYVGQGYVREEARHWLGKRLNYQVKWRRAKSRGEHLAAEFRLILRLQPELNQKGIYKKRRPLASRLTRAQIEEIRAATLKTLSKKRKVAVLDTLELKHTTQSEEEQLEEFMSEIGESLPSPPRSDG